MNEYFFSRYFFHFLTQFRLQKQICFICVHLFQYVFVFNALNSSLFYEAGGYLETRLLLLAELLIYFNLIIKEKKKANIFFKKNMYVQTLLKEKRKSLLQE